MSKLENMVLKEAAVFLEKTSSSNYQLSYTLKDASSLSDKNYRNLAELHSLILNDKELSKEDLLKKIEAFQQEERNISKKIKEALPLIEESSEFVVKSRNWINAVIENDKN